MAHWVLGLPNERADAVDLVKRSASRFIEHDSMLDRLAESDLASDSTTWMHFITHLLRGTPEPSWEIQQYLPLIVKALKKANPPPDLSDLIEEAMRLGCNDAPDW